MILSLKDEISEKEKIYLNYLRFKFKFLNDID